MQASILSDLQILLVQQPPFYQAVAVVVAAMLMILAIGVVEGAVLSVVGLVHRCYRRYRLNRAVAIERAQLRQKQLDGLARMGGR